MSEFLRGIDEQRDDVRFREAGAHVIHHPNVHLVQRLMNARRIQEGDLPARLIEDADDSIARSLRLGRDDGNLMPQDAVEKRRLAGVGTADQGNHAEARLFVPHCASSCSCCHSGSREIRTR